uniref:Uncharacterized protein n=1 Tax=Rhizophagus irregularis (strain DAOM 181602 / DAOM 197198 / MUCL 43194) TaxID=747089 RepID=U9TZN6_RHIID
MSAYDETRINNVVRIHAKYSLSFKKKSNVTNTNTRHDVLKLYNGEFNGNYT